jgi:hypothetical protein
VDNVFRIRIPYAVISKEGGLSPMTRQKTAQEVYGWRSGRARAVYDRGSRVLVRRIVCRCPRFVVVE